MNAAAEVSASLRWCQASAARSELSVSADTLSTVRNSDSLMTTTPSRTANVQGAGLWCGVTISRTAAVAIPNAAPKSSSATMATVNGSALP
jgi:hypothetical protein